MREVGEQILAFLINIAGQALLVVMVAKLTGLMDWLFAQANRLNIKTSAKEQDRAKDAVIEIVSGAVTEVYQTYVKGLKKAGDFGAAEQAEALERAKEIVKDALPVELNETAMKLAGKSAVENAGEALIERVVAALGLNPVNPI